LRIWQKHFNTVRRRSIYKVFGRQVARLKGLSVALRLMEEAIEEAIYEEAFVMREREVETESGKARISYLVCEPMEREGFINAFSTRQGGVSAFPSEALNLAHFKGDAKENVAENRNRFLKAIGAETAAIITARQTHSTERCLIESTEQPPDCDAMTTQMAGLLLGIHTADCLPVLIADTKSGAMAAIHAGWRGTAGRITERTVADLMLAQGVNPRNSIAALGPAACEECYEVGADVIERYKKEFGYWRDLLLNFKEGGKAYLDIRAANIQQLIFCGFNEDRIHVAEYCTMHQNELFFSYRREAAGQPSSVGRLLSVIGRLQ
jgi:YfiH family protein